MSAKTFLALFAAATVGGLAAAGHAAPMGATGGGAGPDRMSVRVAVADLNLDSTAGARVALRRIHNAATLICGETTDVRSLARNALVRACHRTTVDDAVAASHNSVLAALNGRSAKAVTLAAAR
jgi:UrcA family protein